MKTYLFVAFFMAAFMAARCASTPPSTPETQLGARLESASTHLKCHPHYAVQTSCVDEQGLVWTACAWNNCGIEQPCRGEAQSKVAAGSCGEPYWPACKGEPK